MTLPSRRSLILGAGAAIITRRALALSPAPALFRNPLAYPGGNPGFNSNHFAAGPGIRYSAVAQNGNLTNLLTGKPATIVGTITGATTPQGPAVVNTTSASYLHAPGANEQPTAVTIALIYTPTSTLPTTNNEFLFDNNGNTENSNSVYLYIPNAAPTLAVGTTASASYNMTAGVPYFIAVSYSSGGPTANFFVLNLATGKAIANAAALTSTIGTTSASQYNIGGTSTANQQMGGDLSAIMYGVNNYLSLAQLEAWGAAPRDFWYPPTVQNLLLSAVNGKAAATGNGDMGILMP